jgi:hypothetical protein
VLEKGLGNLPWQSFSKMSLVLTPYSIFGSSASEKFPCKPVKDSISSNCGGERIGKSPVAELLEDVVGREHQRILVNQFQKLFIFKVLSDSKIYKKNINQYSFN